MGFALVTRMGDSVTASVRKVKQHYRLYLTFSKAACEEFGIAPNQLVKVYSGTLDDVGKINIELLEGKKEAMTAHRMRPATFAAGVGGYPLLLSARATAFSLPKQVQNATEVAVRWEDDGTLALSLPQAWYPRKPAKDKESTDSAEIHS